MEQITFPKGTMAVCNRCNATSPLPKDCQGHFDSKRGNVHNGGQVLYRLDTMCTLPNCEHMDAHWILK